MKTCILKSLVVTKSAKGKANAKEAAEQSWELFFGDPNTATLWGFWMGLGAETDVPILKQSSDVMPRLCRPHKDSDEPLLQHSERLRVGIFCPCVGEGELHGGYADDLVQLRAVQDCQIEDCSDVGLGSGHPHGEA